MPGRFDMRSWLTSRNTCSGSKIVVYIGHLFEFYKDWMMMAGEFGRNPSPRTSRSKSESPGKVQEQWSYPSVPPCTPVRPHTTKMSNLPHTSPLLLPLETRSRKEGRNAQVTSETLEIQYGNPSPFLTVKPEFDIFRKLVQWSAWKNFFWLRLDLRFLFLLSWTHWLNNSVPLGKLQVQKLN